MVTYAEAMAYENSLTAGDVSALQKPAALFTQPLNKNEGCKLPTSQDQLDRSNFRAYWDGACRDGYAYGLGRDIAISDTHHIEEITIHDGKPSGSTGIVVDYDFLRNGVAYCSIGKQWPSRSCLMERYDNGAEGFDLKRTIGVTDSQGRTFAFQSSPLSPVKVIMEVNGNLLYKFTDLSSVPSSNPSAIISSVEILDKQASPSEEQATGYAIVRYRNGQVRNIKITNGVPQQIALAPEYVAHVQDQYRAITAVLSGARAGIEEAQDMEKQYVFKTCSGSQSIAGLDENTYRQVCTWRENFKEPFGKALTEYKAKLGRMTQLARTEAQRQEALEYQRRQTEAAEAAVSALNWRNLQNSIQQSRPTTCYTFYNATTCY
jgi:hypothetical protein